MQKSTNKIIQFNDLVKITEEIINEEYENKSYEINGNVIEYKIRKCQMKGN